MKTAWVSFLLLMSCWVAGVFSKNRPSSEPFISGDTFRAHCAFVLDEDSLRFDPCLVSKGDTVFVGLGYLEQFFHDYHPKIKNKYILISHNHDFSAPGRFARYLTDEKLFAWFTQNADLADHPKLIPIPIGLSNKWHPHSRNHDIIINRMRRQEYGPKRFVLYNNIVINTNRNERAKLYEYFKKQSYVFTKHGLFDEYLATIAQSKFVLSPHGNGLDCHRTWEALYMGTFPLVKTSTLDRLYDELPVLIVNDWKEVTQSFLEQKYQEMLRKKYKWEKLFFEYWFDLIREYQVKCRAS